MKVSRDIFRKYLQNSSVILKGFMLYLEKYFTGGFYESSD